MTTTNQINQDDINKAVWNACDTFRGVISADTYKDFTLTMLFLKYISDVYKDEYNKLITQYGDNPDLIHAMMSKQRFVLPEGASFWDLYENATKQATASALIKPYTHQKKLTAVSLKMYSKTSALTQTAQAKKNKRTIYCATYQKTLVKTF